MFDESDSFTLAFSQSFRFSVAPCIFNNNAMGLFYTDEVKPKVDITFLMVEQRGRCRRMFRIALPSAVDDDRIAGLQQRSKFALTKGEEKVALANEIDQLFQLVGISEVPHGHSKHNQIGSLEASRKTLYPPPNR